MIFPQKVGTNSLFATVLICRIDQIEFITDEGFVYGPVGGSGGVPFVSTHPGLNIEDVATIPNLT